MFKALDHGIDSIKDKESLIPFVMTENNLERFLGTTLEESLREAEKYLSSFKDGKMLALVYDGYVTIENLKYEAIFVKAFDTNQTEGILIAQRYKPKKFLRKFEILGNPIIIENPSKLQI